MISYYHHQLQTACDENVITTNSLLPRPKSVYDRLYEPLVIILNVVVNGVTVSTEISLYHSARVVRNFVSL